MRQVDLGSPLPALEGANKIKAIVAPATVPMVAESIRRFTSLEVLSIFGVGYDLVDVAAMTAAGVAVTNTPDVLTADVADLAIGLWIAVARRLVVADRYVREGGWDGGKAFPLAARASGRVAGILGLGRIGSAVARRCEAMDMEVLYCSRERKANVRYTFHQSPIDLARDSDVVFICCPGGVATQGLVSNQMIDAIGPQGTLVNIARGLIVDEAALIAALTDGRLGGAGLDVYAQVPVVPQALRDLDNVVLTPHIGSATVATSEAMANLAVDNLINYFRGNPTNCVS